LAAEKEKLRMRIKELQDVQKVAIAAQEKALEDLCTAQAKALEDLCVARAWEEWLWQQIDLLDCCAEEVIAVKEQLIEELERSKANETILFEGLSKGLALNLSPNTWSAFKGLPNDFWESTAFGRIVSTASDNL
jgi:hypothetical protein